MEQSSAILTLENLDISVSRHQRLRPVLRNINLEASRGKVLGILGESGAGKTTLARAMMGWVPAPFQADRGGVLLDGQDLLTLDPPALLDWRRRIGYIGPDPGGAFDPTLPVGHQIVERLRYRRPHDDAASLRKRVVDLLDAVRIPSAKSRFDEFPGQYSGGMLQRAVIVDALSVDPELLICDNIVQPLDVTVAAQIIELLRDLKSEISAAIVFITTSVPSLAEIADDALVLANGEIVERGAPDRIARAPQVKATRDLVDRTPRIWTGEPPPAPLAGDRAPILRIEDVTKTYRVSTRKGFFSKNSVKAVRGVSFDVFEGDDFGLVGESGCGKSTLSRLLSWIETPDSGRIFFDGRDISGMRRAEILSMRKGFQLVLQDPYSSIPPHLPVGKTIGMGLRIHGENSRTIRDRTREVMAQVGLHPDDADHLPVGMSAGQRQRVNVARALILEPRLMILDETLSALDPVEQGRLLDLFERLQVQYGLTYLFISHDLAMVRRACTRIGVMYLGKMVEIADTGELFFNPRHPYTRALLSAVPTLDAKPYAREDCLLDGEPPSPINLPKGCTFAPRCPQAFDTCHTAEPPLELLAPGCVAACYAASGDARRRAAS